MKYKKMKLKDLTVNGKGEYGIGAPAVPFTKKLPTYLRITDINEDGTLNYSSMKSVEDSNYTKYVLRENDIVFARTGNSTGKNYYYDIEDGELVYAGFLIKFSIDPNKVVPKYIKYYCMSEQYYGWVRGFSTGSTRGNINAKTYGDLELLLPPSFYQKKAVSILERIEKKIRLNNQIISNLEELASTLFKRWFVDFEFPDENGNPYKSSGGKMVDSELGEIPEGWGIKKLGEISRIQNGYAFKSKDYIEYSVDNSVKVLRTLNINNDNLSINNKDLVYLPEFFLKHHSNVVLNKFDTLFVMVGATIGKVGLVTDINLPSLQNQNMWRFRPDFPHLSSVILRHYVIHSRNIAENWKTGSAREFYRKDSFSNIRLAIPENRILDKLNSILQPIYELINKKNYENGQLEGLRDSLLPKLLSGEIELPEDEEV